MISVATAVQESLGKIRIQKTRAIVMATLVGALLFLMAAYHDGVLVQLFESGEWRFHLQYPFLIVTTQPLHMGLIKYFHHNM